MKRFFFLFVLCVLVSSQGSLFSQERKDKMPAIEEVILPELFVVDNILQVKNAAIGSRLEVITIVGNKVREYEIKSTNQSFDLNLPKAIYIFKLEGIVRKFVIK